MRQEQTDKAPAPPQLVSVTGLARVLESSEPVARAWAKAHNIPVHRVGRELRFSVDDIRAAVERQL